MKFQYQNANRDSHRQTNQKKKVIGSDEERWMKGRLIEVKLATCRVIIVVLIYLDIIIPFL